MPRFRIKPNSQIGDPWEVLQKAINVTLGYVRSDLRMSSIHKACNELVNKGQNEQIFKMLSDQLKTHFETWHQQLSIDAGDPLITKLYDQYKDFKNYCSVFPKFYMSYDRYYKKEEPNKVLNQIRRLFIQIILSDSNLFENAVTPSILKIIYNAQKGLDIDLTKISSLIDMYYSFRNSTDAPKIFTNFYDKLSEQENDFYNIFFETNFVSHTFPIYLSLAQNQFNLDISIARKILKPEEVTEFMFIFQSCMLSSREKEFLSGPEPAITQALTATNLYPIRWLVETYKEFNVDLEPLYLTCSKYIMNEMLKKTQDFQQRNQNVFELVDQLIKLTINLSDPYSIIFTSKDATDKLVKAIKTAWNDERFDIHVNFNEYIDSLIKEQFTGSSIEEQAPIISRFYQYISDKAKFKNLFESSFVRRLIKTRTKVYKFDFPIIKELRKVTTDFMFNYDAFIKDFNDSNQIKEDYNKLVIPDDRLGKIQIDPLLFQIGPFPLPKDEELNIPPTVSMLNKSFSDFYTEKHHQKQLTLLSQCSTVEFSFRVPQHKKVGARTYTVITDLPCACVLSAVSQNPFKFSEIIHVLNDNKSLATKVVQRLSEPKYKLLQRKGATKTLSLNDEFSLNPTFCSNDVKITVPQIVSEKKTCLRYTIDRDQSLKSEAVRASIVRALKQRHSLEIGVLERCVIENLAEYFVCTAEMVRRGIASCEGEYLSREHANGQNILVYKG